MCIRDRVYIPYLLTERYEVSPTVAGLSLTGGALAWSAAATVQGRMGARLSSVRAVRIGTVLVVVGVVLALVATVLAAPVVVIIVAWIVAGAGMGLMSPRTSALTLEMSAPENQGFNSSAMTVADSFGSALALAITGVLFTGLAAAGDPFIAVFAFAAIIALAAAVLAVRVAPREPRVGRSQLSMDGVDSAETGGIGGDSAGSC